MTHDNEKPNSHAVLAALAQIIQRDPALQRTASVYAALHKSFPPSVDVLNILDSLGASSPDAQARAVELVEAEFLAMSSREAEKE